MSVELRLILSASCIGLLLLFKLLLSVTQKKHREDPVHMENQRRREEAYRQRIEQENEELQQYVFDDNEFFDDVSLDNHDDSENISTLENQ